MSQIISLVQYNYHNEKLYEENSETIETSFISEDCIDIIRESVGTAIIYEDKGSDESYEIDCVGNIAENMKLYEDKFIELFEDKDIKNNEHISNSINLFRTLTNVYHIFWLKNEKFSNNDDVLIKLG